MENKQSYDQMLEAAQNLSQDQIKTPVIPVGTYIQEAEDLSIWSAKDKDKLMAAGIPEITFVNLNILAGALRYSQSIWSEEMKCRQEAEQLWKEEAPLAFEFRNNLLHSFRYAYRNSPSLMANVAAIAQGSDIADMIQDLNDLAVLGQNNIEPLKTIGFTEDKLGTAAELSSKMATLRARANGDKYENNPALEIRNRFYTLLKQNVDEIRNCGKYLFWKDSSRLVGYISQYKKKKNHGRKANRTEIAE